MKKILFIISLVVIGSFFVPYLFQKQLNIIVANNYVDKFKPEWDTVFVNLKDKDIEKEDLTITNNRYDVEIWKDEDKVRYNHNYKNATIIIDEINQIGFYSKVYIEVFKWEGTKCYTEEYLCIFNLWFRISQELTGMA